MGYGWCVTLTLTHPIAFLNEMWTDVMGYRRGKALPCPYTGTQLKWKRYIRATRRGDLEEIREAVRLWCHP
jgi:hypothetical protein